MYCIVFSRHDHGDNAIWSEVQETAWNIGPVRADVQVLAQRYVVVLYIYEDRVFVYATRDIIRSRIYYRIRRVLVAEEGRQHLSRDSRYT